MISLFKPIFRSKWEYGTCNGVPARRSKSGNVQYVMWKAGEHNHTEDFWVDFNSYWWPNFKARL